MATPSSHTTAPARPLPCCCTERAGIKPPHTGPSGPVDVACSGGAFRSVMVQATAPAELTLITRYGACPVPMTTSPAAACSCLPGRDFPVAFGSSRVQAVTAASTTRAPAVSARQVDGNEEVIDPLRGKARATCNPARNRRGRASDDDQLPLIIRGRHHGTARLEMDVHLGAHADLARNVHAALHRKPPPRNHHPPSAPL